LPERSSATPSAFQNQGLVESRLRALGYIE
jgi:hypothetical protein